MEIHKVKISEDVFSGKRKTIYITVALAALVAVVLLGATYKVVAEKREKVIALEQVRLQGYVAQRTRAFNRVLESYVAETDRLIESDLFRLYASEVESVDGDLSALVDTGVHSPDEGEGLSELTAQIPLMENMLREFATNAGFLHGRVLSTKAETYLATDLYLPSVSKEQKDYTLKAVKSGKVTYGPIQETSRGLEVDFFLPLFPPEGGEEDDAPVGVVSLTRQVSGDVAVFLSKTPLSLVGEATHLVEKVKGNYYEIIPWSATGANKIDNAFFADMDQVLPFAQRASLDGSLDVFSMGQRAVGEWFVIQEVDVRTILDPVAEFGRALYAIAWLGVFAISLVMGLAWWILVGVRSRKQAEVFAEQARVIAEQKQFINSINESIDDFIVLKDLSGKYLYANEVFAEAVGRSKESLVGMDDGAILGFGTATRLMESDEQVIEKQEKVVVSEDIFLQSREYNFQISKMPYFDDAMNCVGVVQVYRDITEVVAMQKKAHRLNRQTVAALGATIEAVDPYLADHTRLMVYYTEAMAGKNKYPINEKVELVMAANLSQIGKAFIPKDILSKPGRLSDNELAIVEKHVEHSCKILRDIHVPDPVLEMIAQMNENLDGSGYPKKLVAEQITAHARLLGVINVFCALVSPRSYRSALSEEEAFEVIAKNPERYDQDTVASFQEVVRRFKPQGVLQKEIDED